MAFSEVIRGIPADFLLEVSKGNVPGTTIGVNFAVNRDIGTTASETLWDYGNSYNYLSANTTIYISSSSALDTGVEFTVAALDDNYEPITVTVTTNGQNQVAFSAPIFRIVSGVVSNGTSPVGNLYLAESDTLTAGVPDTATKVQGLVPLSGFDTGTDFASDNVIHNGVITVPAGKTLHLINIQTNTGKNQDVEFSGRVRVENGIWTNRNPIPLYQRTVDLIFNIPIPFPERTDIEFRGIAGSPNSFGSLQTHYLLVDN